MALQKELARSGKVKAEQTETAELTIEQRLNAKATAADNKVFVTCSLGQLTREERRKLLFG